MQDEDRPLIDRKPAECPLQLVAVGAAGVRRRWPIHGQDADVGGPLASPLRFVVAGMNEDPLDPRLEAIRLPKLRQPPEEASPAPDRAASALTGAPLIAMYTPHDWMYTLSMKRLQIYIDEAVDDELARRAIREGTSKAALIRASVAELLQVERTEPDPLDALVGRYDAEPGSIYELGYDA